MARAPNPTLSAPEQLSPSARPVQSYVAPGSGSTGLTEAMRAMATLSPTLGKYAEKIATEDRVAQEALAERKLGGMTFEQSKAAVKDGSMHEFASPWFRAAFEKSYGERAGNEVRRAAEEHLATTDMSEGDAEAWTADYLRQASDELPQGKFASAGFAGAIDGLTDKVRDKVNSDRTARTVESRNENYVANTLGTIDSLKEKGADEAAILAEVRNLYKGQRDFLGVSYRDQDKLMGDVLKTIAQRPGYENIVTALGKLDRDGVPLSVKLGSSFEALQDNALATTQGDVKDKLQPQVSTWSLAASNGELDVDAFRATTDPLVATGVLSGEFQAGVLARDQNAREARAAQAQARLQSTAKETALIGMSPQLVALARQGNVAEIQELTAEMYGKTLDFSQSELKEVALKGAAAELEAEGQAQGLDAATVRKNVISMYGDNGEDDPLTVSRVKAFLRSTQTGGDIPQTSLDYLPELQAAYDAAPEMVQRLSAAPRDRLYLSSIMVALDLGLTPAEAARNAAWRRDNMDRITVPGGKERRETIDAVAGRLSDNGGARSVIDPFIAERVDYYASAGATGKDLEKRVATSIERTHAFVGGRLIDVTGTKLPASKTLPIFADMAAELKVRKPSFARDTITFQPVRRGSSTFRAVTSMGTIIPGSEKTWAEMQALHTTRKTARLGTVATTASNKGAITERLFDGVGALARGAMSPGI
ncbi:hypothetical protein [Phenylobacterium sp.]|uniref:hypothetical protein n=1 Tax=Phenylobacterium sp. TaxID=1871053 RepID=UPI002737F79E|nr:hypothetical protein [Phenylobacterium sp.]MDP3869931.1 hypothetical protein [Phenylobacterium sp.]